MLSDPSLHTGITFDVAALIPTDEESSSTEAAKALRKWVDHAYQVTNKELLSILFNKYQFEKHCISIRKYLLMAQGDFMQCLMDNMAPELSNPAS